MRITFGHPSAKRLRLLVHRRGSDISNLLKIATPGGWVNKGTADKTFEQLACQVAVRELLEEAGFVLRPETFICFPVSEHDETRQHLNFAAILRKRPDILGPVSCASCEVERDGLTGIREAAGDDCHAWVEPQEMLERDDLLEACRALIKAFLSLFST